MLIYPSLGVAREKSAIVGTHAPTTDEDSGKGKIVESTDVVGAVSKPNVENQELDRQKRKKVSVSSSFTYLNIIRQFELC
ncbi:unnamed protein product [Lathyrus oleraceus]